MQELEAQKAHQIDITAYTREFLCGGLYSAIGFLKESILPASRAPLVALAIMLKGNAYFVA